MELRRDVFQAIADPTRRAIITLVALQAMTPSAIAEHFDSTRQTISRHIRILTECDLLRQEHSGREIHYHLNALKMKEIADFIEPFRQMWDNRFNKLESIMKNYKELKTKVDAEAGKQELFITRDFDLPVELVFRAYVEPDILEQWMGTKVLKLDCRRHGSFEFETTDPRGGKFRLNGTIHEFETNQKITRTFEMEGGPAGITLEFLEFQHLTNETSRLRIHTIFRSVSLRDELLKLPFAWGLSMAHNKLEEVMKGTQQR